MSHWRCETCGKYNACCRDYCGFTIYFCDKCYDLIRKSLIIDAKKRVKALTKAK